MTISYVSITSHDPLISRDGRPFGKGQGNRMRSLEWIYPSMLAGSIRTMLGKMMGGSFTPGEVETLKRLSISGPFPLVNGLLYIPAPKDILVKNENGNRSSVALRPMSLREGEGCDLPKGLRPAMHKGEEEFKPEKVPAFWSMTKMTDWLMDSEGMSFGPPATGEDLNDVLDFMNSPEKEERIHVEIDSETGTSKEGQLFSTTGLDLTRNRPIRGEPLQFAARIESDGTLDGHIKDLDTLHPLGGERRLAHWKSQKMVETWAFPSNMTNCFEGALGKRLRLILATPALFSGGWLPGWLDMVGDSIAGRPPGAPEDVTLKLVSACVDHWRPISGWSVERGKRGPKPVRRLVPAGSVYFFEVLSGNAEELVRRLWLKPLSDDEQDRRDGFGLALWGVWNAPKNE